MNGRIWIYYMVMKSIGYYTVRVELDVAHQFLKAMDIFEIVPIDPCLSDFDIVDEDDLDEFIKNTARYSTKKEAI